MAMQRFFLGCWFIFGMSSGIVSAAGSLAANTSDILLFHPVQSDQWERGLGLAAIAQHESRQSPTYRVIQMGFGGDKILPGVQPNDLVRYAQKNNLTAIGQNDWVEVKVRQQELVRSGLENPNWRQWGEKYRWARPPEYGEKIVTIKGRLLSADKGSSVSGVSYQGGQATNTSQAATSITLDPGGGKAPVIIPLPSVVGISSMVGRDPIAEIAGTCNLSEASVSRAASNLSQ